MSGLWAQSRELKVQFAKVLSSVCRLSGAVETFSCQHVRVGTHLDGRLNGGTGAVLRLLPLPVISHTLWVFTAEVIA